MFAVPMVLLVDIDDAKRQGDDLYIFIPRLIETIATVEWQPSQDGVHM